MENKWESINLINPANMVWKKIGIAFGYLVSVHSSDFMWARLLSTTTSIRNLFGANGE